MRNNYDINKWVRHKNRPSYEELLGIKHQQRLSVQPYSATQIDAPDPYTNQPLSSHVMRKENDSRSASKITSGLWKKQSELNLNNHDMANRKESSIGIKITNSYINKGLCSMSAKNKYYKQHLPSLPVTQIGSNKRVYKCSDLSSSPHGKVIAYGLHSTSGAVRPYNEDRVVEYHTTLTDDYGVGTNFSFFGVYDGHGGSQWSKYLASELHLAIADDQNLLRSPAATIRRHIFEIDNSFLKFYLDNPTSAEYQRAGSWLNLVIIIGEFWYVANVGDCRSIMSAEGGRVVYQLSKDHKPSDPDERDRVIDAGGKIYVSSIKQTQGTSGLSLLRTDKIITK